MIAAQPQAAFGLPLTGGQCWHILGTGRHHRLVEKLAQIMGLAAMPQAQQTAARLVFTDADSHLFAQRNMHLLFTDLDTRIWRSSAGDETWVEALQPNGNEKPFHPMRIGVQVVQHGNVLRGGLPVHAALVECNGQGVLLAGKSGIGKSTACRRLPASRRVLGDDEALISRDGCAYLVHPLPTWSHYFEEDGHLTWPVASKRRLAAIFLSGTGR